MRNTVIGFYDKFGYDVNLIDNNGQIIETVNLPDNELPMACQNPQS